MKKLLICLLSVFLLLTTFGCKTNNPTDGPSLEDEAFNQLLDKWFVEDMESDYLSMHFNVKDSSKYNINAADVTLGNVEISDEDIENVKNRYQTLVDYDISKLSASQLVTYKTALSYYKIELKGYELDDDYGFVFTPNSGVNNGLITNFQEFEIRSEQDAKDLITLVVDSERFIDECIAYTENQANDGVIQSKPVIDAVLEQLRRFADNESECAVITDFNAQIDKLGYSDSYKSELADAVNNHMIPAYKRIIQMYEKLYANAPESKMIYEYENGKTYYEALVANKTSTEKTMLEIEDELEGAVDSTLNSLMKVLDSEDYSDYNYTTPEAALEFFKQNMSKDYPAIPEVNYTVNFLDPSVTSENTAAYYLLSPVDDIKDNVIKVNPNYGETDPNGLMLTLAHEGYPGHCYQHTYFYSTNPHPFRSCMNFTAYAEGWAMYVEDWAYGLLEKDSKCAKASSLFDQLMYYIYAYVDILYNYEGYDTDDVANYLGQIFNEEYAQNYAESLKTTVMGDPGLFIPYGYGEFKMLDLKNKAIDLAGRKFDLKEFNTLILNTGDTSYEVLEEIVKEYYSK